MKSNRKWRRNPGERDERGGAIEQQRAGVRCDAGAVGRLKGMNEGTELTCWWREGGERPEAEERVRKVMRTTIAWMIPRAAAAGDARSRRLRQKPRWSREDDARGCDPRVCALPRRTAPLLLSALRSAIDPISALIPGPPGPELPLRAAGGKRVGQARTSCLLALPLIHNVARSPILSVAGRKDVHDAEARYRWLCARAHSVWVVAVCRSMLLLRPSWSVVMRMKRVLWGPHPSGTQSAIIAAVHDLVIDLRRLPHQT